MKISNLQKSVSKFMPKIFKRLTSGSFQQSIKEHFEDEKWPSSNHCLRFLGLLVSILDKMFFYNSVPVSRNRHRSLSFVSASSISLFDADLLQRRVRVKKFKLKIYAFFSLFLPFCHFFLLALPSPPNGRSANASSALFSIFLAQHWSKLLIFQIDELWVENFGVG
jgi:hypothetical protein